MNGKTDQIGPEPNGNSVQSIEHWNRLPDSVLSDKRLSFAAKCVYAVLAGTIFQGTIAKIGQRRIAETLGCHQETVVEALKDLVLFGHIQIVKSGKQRYWYHMTSNVFGQKQASGEVEEVQVHGPEKAPRKRLVSAAITPTVRMAAAAARIANDRARELSA